MGFTLTQLQCETNNEEEEEEIVEGNDNYTNECNANSEEILMVVLGEDDENPITTTTITAVNMQNPLIPPMSIAIDNIILRARQRRNGTKTLGSK